MREKVKKKIETAVVIWSYSTPIISVDMTFQDVISPLFPPFTKVP